jgi:predicted NAD/FAD-dependent oxidoreductase
MSKYCVIGSGISGATIANLLSKNHSVDLFDKARGPGGRSSFKRLDKDKGFDHGTQYISPKSPAFKKFINILIKKTNKNVSSYLFDDNVLGWAAKENSKKRFKSHQDLWTLQSTHKWANKKINKNRENKDINSKTLIDHFFKLTDIKKTKVLFSLNHGWKYSSNSNPLNIKSYWNSSLNLGVCADWFVGPRLEAGWISANDLYKKIIK